ncbi:PAS domain-containing protein [Halobaculum limi]|uniref:PAS domain-containing protein n=1 Tax=Halobaculum limi TaxID=3031916 RepID=UPI00240511D8|nr:PAS domain-containing protein [Halobaculum sp. YSMS11]
MLSRDELGDLLQLDDERFHRRVAADVETEEYDVESLRELADDYTDSTLLESMTAATADDVSLGDRERGLIRRIRVFDEATFGITLTGPAYADNPVRYANQKFRDLTGYSLGDLHEENLRLLQGPDTDPGPVADLREALSTWSRATTTLTNYRADGTQFRNRVSIVPVTDRGGSVVNWIGIQEQVDE